MVEHLTENQGVAGSNPALGTIGCVQVRLTGLKSLRLMRYRINAELVRTGMAEATGEKLRWITEAADERLDAIELGSSVFFASVTEDRESIASALAPSMGFEPRDVLEMPHFLIGTIQQIEADLKLRRERYGFSDVIIPGDAAEQLAPVVERFAGN